MYLLEGAAAPDHNTIARFRSRHLAACQEQIQQELVLSHFSDYNRGLSKTQGLGVSQMIKCTLGRMGQRMHFSGVYGHRMCLLLQYSLIRVFQIVLFIGRTL